MMIFFWNGDPENDAIADRLEMELEQKMGGILGGNNIEMYQALEEKPEKYDDAEEEEDDDGNNDMDA